MTPVAVQNDRANALSPDRAAHETQQSRIVRAVAAATALFAIEEPTADRWLRAAAERVLEGIGGGGALVAFIACAARQQAGWKVHRVAVAGLEPRESARAVLKQAQSGWPDDDLNSPERDQAAGARGRVIRRRDLAGDHEWARSRWRRWRRRMGLHAFVRCARSFDDERGPRTLVLEAEGTSTGWESDNLFEASLNALTEAVRDGFVRRFVAPGQRRRELLARLTETRAVIAPLLADGYTESEIAKMLGRSSHTVHDHSTEIYRMWGVRSRFALRDLWNGADSLPGYISPVR